MQRTYWETLRYHSNVTSRLLAILLLDSRNLSLLSRQFGVCVGIKSLRVEQIPAHSNMWITRLAGAIESSIESLIWVHLAQVKLAVC